MEQKYLEIKESRNMVKETQFEVKVPTNDTWDNKVFETHFSSTIEGKHK